MKNHIFGYLIPSVSKSHNNVSGSVCVFSVSLCVTETDENVFLFFLLFSKKEGYCRAGRRRSENVFIFSTSSPHFCFLFSRLFPHTKACARVYGCVYLNKQRVIQFQFLPSNGSTKTRKGCRRGRPEGKIHIFGNFSGCLLFFWGKVLWFFF